MLGSNYFVERKKVTSLNGRRKRRRVSISEGTELKELVGSGYKALLHT